MTTEGFTVQHAADASFERGLRAFFEYRDLGMERATKGKVTASIIRAVPGTEFVGKRHRHLTEFQMVYVLKGWIEFDYQGHGVERLVAGSCVYQPPGIEHTEIGHSDDLELLEIVMPADFGTEEV
ncbi:MAG: cupin domain-containing protein [Burkholderiaceae bacterium]